MRIVLLGYMGSGKTTVGKRLAAELKIRFLDLDAYIETGEKRSIPEIFQEKGELYFRRKEHFYLQDVLSKETDFVLSTGGGTACYANNMEALLASTATVVYLKVPIIQLANRLSKQKAQRPLIRHIPDDGLPEFIGKHLFERSGFYNRANLTIECGIKGPEVIAAEIIKVLNENGSL